MRMAEQAETNQRFLRQLEQAIEFYSIPASQQFRGVAVKVEEAKKPSRAKVGAKS